MSVLRRHGGKNDKLHYLAIFLAKWIDNQDMKNIRFYWFWIMVSLWERESKIGKFLHFREIIEYLNLFKKKNMLIYSILRIIEFKR